MAITQITAGQKDWLSTLNSDLSQIGDKVTSISIPVTFVNGNSGDISVMHYTFGSHILNTVQGWVKLGENLNGGTATNVVKGTAGTDLGDIWAWTISGSIYTGKCSVANDGTVSITMEATTTSGNTLNLMGFRAY